MGFSIQFPVNLNPDIHDDSFYLLESSFSFSLDSIVVSLFVDDLVGWLVVWFGCFRQQDLNIYYDTEVPCLFLSPKYVFETQEIALWVWSFINHDIFSPVILVWSSMHF